MKTLRLEVTNITIEIVLCLCILEYAACAPAFCRACLNCRQNQTKLVIEKTTTDMDLEAEELFL